MQTVVIDILNEKALSLLKDLESLKLIKLRGGKSQSISKAYKGAMTKQPLSKVNEQLTELRESWQ